MEPWFQLYIQVKLHTIVVKLGKFNDCPQSWEIGPAGARNKRKATVKKR